MDTATHSNRSIELREATRASINRVIIWIVLLAAANLLVIYAIRWLPRPSRGWVLEFRDLLQFGMSAGHLGLAIFVISFGHFRGPLRQLICSLFLVVSVSLLPRGEFFGNAMAGFVQIYFLAALWFGYVLLAIVRWAGGLEFGLPSLGDHLPPNARQFRIHSMGIMAAVVSIPLVLTRILMSIFSEFRLRPGPADYFYTFLVPLLLIVGLLLAIVPFLYLILRRGRTIWWSVLGIAWGAAPAILIWNYINPQIKTMYEVFWGTIVFNLLLMRLIGFRWLSTEEVGIET